MEYYDADPIGMGEAPFDEDENIFECSFVPCPYCGREIACPEQGFETVAEAVKWALSGCHCAGARAWQTAGCPELLEDGPCASGQLLDNGRCGHYGGAIDCTREKCGAWHPELCAAELQDAGITKWAKRKAEAEAAERWKPTADLIAYILTLPAPEPVCPPKIYPAGTCKWCGQRHMLDTPAKTQQAADDQAAASCNCYEGNAARLRQQEHDIISAMFADAAEDTIDLLHKIAGMIRCGDIASGTAIKVSSSVTAKFKLKDGAVTVTRAEKLERQHSFV